jgi:hypothetical protein
MSTILWVIGILLVVLVIIGVVSASGAAKPASGTVGRITPQPGRAGRYLTDVVGEASYQAALDEIAGGKTYDAHEIHIEASLVLEDTNRHDRNAVQIQIAGRTVGYLARATAKQFRAKVPRGVRVFACNARITGGWKRGRDTGHYGVKLDI